jgi:hypothetical protein
MSRTWNPAARRETVAAFLSAWCVQEAGRTCREETLFGAYEAYCRRVRRADLTQGEFSAEMERLGYAQGQRHGTAVWQGIGLTYQEDGLVGREYGARYREE